jgi:streptogramin lyase
MLWEGWMWGSIRAVQSSVSGLGRKSRRCLETVPVALALLVAVLVWAAPAIAAPVGTVTEFPLPASDAGAESIAAGPEGDIWLSVFSFEDNKIIQVTPRGAVAAEHKLPGSRLPESLAFAENGDLWVQESAAGEPDEYMGLLTPGGSFQQITLPFLDGAHSEDMEGSELAGLGEDAWFTGFEGSHGESELNELTPGGDVSKFKISGEFKFESGPASGPLTVGPDGALWIIAPSTLVCKTPCEYIKSRIDRISTGGGVSSFAIAADTEQDEHIPNSIAAGPDGNVWFTELDASEIGRITPTGTITEFPLPSGSRPVDIAAGPDGNLWFTEDDGKIGRMSPTGAITEFELPNSYAAAANKIVAGPEGNMWFSQPNAGEFGEIATGGTPPPAPKAETPPPPPSPPPTNEDGAGIPPASCAQSSIHFSVLTAHAGCFVKHGSTWDSSGRVRINGVDITPQKGVNVEIDPSKLSLSVKLASVDLGSLLVYEGPMHVDLGSPFRLKVPSETKIKGIALEGELLLEPTSAGMDVTANAMVGEQEGPNVTGEIKLQVTNTRGLVLEHLKLTVGEIELAKPKGLKIEKAELTYEHGSTGDVWAGAVSVALPEPLPGVEGKLAITNGRLSEIGVVVSTINKPIGEIVYLQKLGLDVDWEPNVAVTGTLGLSAGPILDGLEAPLAELEATLAVEFAQPTVITATGNLTLIGKVPLANGEAKWTLPDHFEFHGEASLEEGPASIRVAGYGLVSNEGFAFKGEGEISVPDVSGAGLAYMSEKGLTGCASVSTGPLTVYGGFGYHWGGELELWADNCEMLKFKTAAHLSSATNGPVSFTVPSGQAETLIGARGEGGYPSYTLTSPHGHIISRTGGEQGAVGPGGYRWVTDPTKNGTYVLLGKPEPGTWTLTPLAGSPPIDWTASALSAPPAKVKTRVIRHGHRDLLEWSANPAPGQTLRFEEVGRRTADVILRTSKAHGQILFTPANTGAGEGRHLQIEVAMSGLPRKILTGASFSVSAPPRPLAPRHVSIYRRGRGVLISWTPPTGARTVEVLVTSSDGRRERFRVNARQHSLSFPNVIAPAHLTVSITALATDGVKSKPRLAHALFASPAAHPKKRRRGRH